MKLSPNPTKDDKIKAVVSYELGLVKSMSQEDADARFVNTLKELLERFDDKELETEFEYVKESLEDIDEAY